MKRLVLLLPMLLLMFGCSRNYYNVPADSLAEKVKVLGVAPIIIDLESDIRHPQKEQLLAMVTGLNRSHEVLFVRKLKKTNSFYSVSLLGGEPRSIFANLYSRREVRNDASIQYNKYFWKGDEMREYLRRNNLDALMLIVVSGITKVDKVSSANMLSSLTSEFNYLIMTAQIVDANGTVLWEYPNFRRRFLGHDPLVALQYADFSEAKANLSDSVTVKFRSLEGIKRSFEEKDKDILWRETQESQTYIKQFDEMVSVLEFEPLKDRKNGQAAEKPRLPQNNPAYPENHRTPEVAPPVSSVPASSAAPAMAAPPTDEIVPAAGPAN